LSPHRWPWLAAIALVLPVHAAAQSDAPRPVNGERPSAGAGSPFSQGLLIGTFGNWEIRKGLIDNTYLLIGESTGDGDGHFWLHCDQNNLITVAVPLAERPAHDRLRCRIPASSAP
jgi:hypothetical protein